MSRIDKINYYLDMAETASERSTCLRRRYGCIIVKNDKIVSTGYNGSPRDCENCIDTGVCIREQMGVPRGTRYELCAGLHAEQNALESVGMDDKINADMYLVGIEIDANEYIKSANSCSLCKKLIINAGIKNVYIRETKTEYRIVNPQEWVKSKAYIGDNGY
jgi:dCMP deaminase